MVLAGPTHTTSLVRYTTVKTGHATCMICGTDHPLLKLESLNPENPDPELATLSPVLDLNPVLQEHYRRIAKHIKATPGMTCINVDVSISSTTPRVQIPHPKLHVRTQSPQSRSHCLSHKPCVVKLGGLLKPEP